MYLIAIIDQLTYFKKTEYNKFLRTINPLKIIILIMELLSYITISNHQTATKCSEIKKKYYKLATDLISEISDKRSLEYIFKDKDLENRELILIIAQNNFLDLLKNSTAENLISKIWKSTYTSTLDTHQSSMYQIIHSKNPEFVKSFLKHLIERQAKDYKIAKGSFLIWNESINTKYYSFLFLFVSIVIFYQVITAIFLTGIGPKITIGLQIYETVGIFLDNFYLQFKTNFTLTQISTYLKENNTTFIDDYYSKLPENMTQNLTTSFQLIEYMSTEIVKDKYNLYVLTKSTYLYVFIIFDIIFRIIYRKKTGVKLEIFNIKYILDLVAVGMVFYRYIYLDEIFYKLVDFERIDSYDDNKRKSWSYNVSIFFICLWLKGIIMLKFSVYVGALLRILELICKSIAIFGIILLSEIFIFACIGNILFATDDINTDYSSPSTSFLACFRAMMNDFNYYNFEEGNKTLAAIFITSHLIVSTIIMMNFLIAILSHIYETFTVSAVLLMNQDIVLKKNEFLPDPTYSSLILTPFPFSIINIFMMPIYFFCNSKKKLRQLNSILLMLAYSPMYFYSIIYFTLCECIYLPFALAKLVYHSIFGVCNSLYFVGQKKQTSLQKFKNSIMCFLLIILFPLVFIYCFIFDLILYTQCLLIKENDQYSYLEEEDLVTPFILNKMNEVFDDKYRSPDIPVKEVIDDFTENLRFSNSKFDFRNVLINANHKESVNLVKEYSTFVKFIDKVRLKNEYNEETINKSLLLKLIESNTNFCKAMMMYKKSRIDRNNNYNKIFPDDIKKSTTFSYGAVITANNYQPSDDNDDEYIGTDNFLEMQEELGRSEKKRRSIVSLSLLPKLFYKRLYMINLQDVKNALLTLENASNTSDNNQKIRTELKIIKKAVLKVSNAVNAKEYNLQIKKSQASIRRERQSLFSRMSKKSSFGYVKIYY